MFYYFHEHELEGKNAYDEHGTATYEKEISLEMVMNELQSIKSLDKKIMEKHEVCVQFIF